MNFTMARIEKMSNTELIGEFGFFESMVFHRLNISKTHSVNEIVEEEQMLIEEMARRFRLDATRVLELINQ